MATQKHKQVKSIAHVIDVDMGYGHSRAAYALKDLSGGTVLTANEYPGIPEAEKKLWKSLRQAYESLSRFRAVPLVGKALFALVEKVEEIPEFYPRRDMSDLTLALRQVYGLIVNKGLGKHMADTLNRHPLPVVCTHPVPAIALEAHGYVGDIWCVPTDADVARVWAAVDPKGSRIRYFCANGRLVERLKLYGVRESQLYLTGFPLPKELIGGPKGPLIVKLMLARLANLDPNRIFFDRYKSTLMSELGRRQIRYTKTHPFTLSYAVGGAGAQRAIGHAILASLRLPIKRNRLRLNLVAGTRPDVLAYFTEAVRASGLAPELGHGVKILYRKDRAAYFAAFNRMLRTTDVLWTKPSELAFYSALGLPVIMAPPLGRQEDFNAAWLTYVGSGIPQADPLYVNEWLFDWLQSGGLARAAWNGFAEAPTYGTYRIEDVLRGRKPKLLPPPLIV